ncbi:hypothetical protein [Streptomyces sp. 4N124]|uniref:hypothetical protein n=1 Tax=Streptomyces sp. 4N124 TaxID=3457420 RepID=UPI003FD5350F
MSDGEPLAIVPLVAYRSAPPGAHIAQCQGENCTLTARELIVPGAKYDRVPLSHIGAVHHEHDASIFIDAMGYGFGLECQSGEVRDQLAFYIAYAAGCSLFDADGLVNMKKLERRYLG